MKIFEVDDQVMVGFVHNHPDRHFVMGGMFHGQFGLGGGADNRVKSIQKRSGHKVIFTEDESIVITDKSGNEIHLDTTGSNINLTAPEAINIKCKNMNIDVEQNMTTNVGMNISVTAGLNFTESAGVNYTNTAGGMMYQNAVLDYSLMASNIMNIASENFSYDATDIHKNATEGIEVSATKDYVQNSE